MTEISAAKGLVKEEAAVKAAKVVRKVARAVKVEKGGKEAVVKAAAAAAAAATTTQAEAAVKVLAKAMAIPVAPSAAPPV